MKNKMTLEEFADLINEADEWKLEFDDIIFANGWTFSMTNLPEYKDLITQ